MSGPHGLLSLRTVPPSDKGRSKGGALEVEMRLNKITRFLKMQNNQIFETDRITKFFDLTGVPPFSVVVAAVVASVVVTVDAVVAVVNNNINNRERQAPLCDSMNE